MTDTLTPDDFWSRLDDVQAGMLSAGAARPVPMSHYVDREARALWFITANGTDLAQSVGAAATPARYILASGDGKIYARVDGTASVSHDAAKLDEIWNFVADAWFEGGKRDDDIVLVRFDLSEAEVWTTDGGVRFLYEMAKAQATDRKPDVGSHGTLRFAA